MTTRTTPLHPSIAQPSRFNLGPRALAAAADSDTTVRYCWFGVDDGTVDLMLSDRDDRGRPRVRRLLRSGSSPMFESFQLDTTIAGLTSHIVPCKWRSS